MYKLANQVIDAYDDLYWDHLKKVAEARPQTNILTPDEKSKLGDDDYALSYITKEATKLNKFPIHDLDNAWLSNEYFPLTQHKLAADSAKVAATFIKKACERFGIEPKEEVTKLAGTYENNLYFEPMNNKSERNAIAGMGDAAAYLQEKTASANNDTADFADINRICDNYTHAQYVFANADLVKTACAYFEEKHTKMPLELRHKYAAAIQMRAEELGMGAQKGTIAKYASDAYSGDLDGHLSSRRRLLDGNPLTGELNKLASARKSFTPSQFAQLLHAFDKKACINQYYGGYLKDPYQATFAQAPDQDSHVRWSNKTASRKLTDAEIQKVVGTHNVKIAEYFGKHMADEMKKDPISIFDSLPNDAKEIIANIHEGTL